ncbi:DNA-binding NarL/FixJ family response regulator [Actinoplanes campanulatus]|uniref:DNA-binding NarL/FixJ family response regulator n=1 Tax=Actinoplanes campanulatus TaxID=113559 RepID=A0A7W5FJF7_9ACTN|nr:response regulator transcription factor [Actinoplanes campanulatus]MBB3100719.1 DNA-binding NarL/FixJ family response regulator [Actinoplanes campanulatus]GGN46008.1 DNA-binding response regulator [Actinoplanes campanulatus]GID41218.1 DNA-binding response regulator [Actinoplanes campanulatus]
MARVLICAVHTLTRLGLRAVVDGCPGVALAGEAADGQQALGMVRSLRPDVLIADEAPPQVDGVELSRRTRDDPAAPAVLLLLDHSDQRVVEGLRAGALGMLNKDCEPAELGAAVRAVTAGRRFVSTRPGGRTLAGVPPALARLTPREREVLVLLAGGLSNEEISAQLLVTRPTVKYHVSHLLQKLDVRDRLQAAVFAYQHGITGPTG